MKSYGRMKMNSAIGGPMIIPIRAIVKDANTESRSSNLGLIFAFGFDFDFDFDVARQPRSAAIERAMIRHRQ